MVESEPYSKIGRTHCLHEVIEKNYFPRDFACQSHTAVVMVSTKVKKL